MPNLFVWVARNAANDMVRYAAEFGFTPCERSRTHLEPPATSSSSGLTHNYFGD
jgi:phage terminase small subunit